MKQFFFFVIILFGSFLLQGMIQHFPFVSFRVDLVWLIVLYVGFFIPVFPGVFSVFIIGLSVEGTGAPLHGILTISYLLVYFFLRLVNKQLYFEMGLAQMIWVFLLSLVQKGIEMGLLAWGGYDPQFSLGLIFVPAIFNALFSFPFFLLLRRGIEKFSRYGT